MQKDGKQKIIDAAQRLIARQGVEKTSMRDIAEEAGMTTGAIYYYYKSKEELLYDVMDYATAITSNVMQMRKMSSASPDAVLGEIARLTTQRLQAESVRRLRYYLAYQAALGDEALRQKFATDYSAQAQRTAELFNYVFSTEQSDEDIYLAVLMVAALDGINLQQFIGALPVDIDHLSQIYNEFFAVSIPAFFAYMKEHGQFRFLTSKPDTDAAEKS
jgi:AcrR family transcriptional regulator